MSSSGNVRERVTALIPARGGSRRLPGKNLRPFGGFPLITWTIRAAREARIFDRVLVSSDDEEILSISRDAGAETLLRPAEFARDDTSSMEVVWHASDASPSDAEVLMLLQPTSPLRRASDICESLRLMRETAAPSVVSVCGGSKHPEWTYRLDDDARLHPLDGRAGGNIVGLNGAIYAARLSWLRAENSFIGEGTVGYRMPDERSVDIDTMEEFIDAERRLAQH